MQLRSGRGQGRRALATLAGLACLAGFVASGCTEPVGEAVNTGPPVTGRIRPSIPLPSIAPDDIQRPELPTTTSTSDRTGSTATPGSSATGDDDPDGGDSAGGPGGSGSGSGGAGGSGSQQGQGGSGGGTDDGSGEQASEPPTTVLSPDTHPWCRTTAPLNEAWASQVGKVKWSEANQPPATRAAVRQFQATYAADIAALDASAPFDMIDPMAAIVAWIAAVADDLPAPDITAAIAAKGDWEEANC